MRGCNKRLMTQGTSTFAMLQQRGLVAQTTGNDVLTELLSRTEGVPFYIGFDPTGPSLHVGHLVTLMTVRHLARAGHKPILIVGGGTAMVGDPSGKSEMRPMLDEATVADNVRRIKAQIVALVPGSEVTVVDNATWLKNLGYIDFLRTIGRHFSVNRMLSMEAYKARLAHGLSFIEFNYQLLQAYDFLQLHQRLGCLLQLGGDDQWGNILAGIDLCRRVAGAKVEGLTVPLLTTASGAKMGKTAQGAVWLDAERLDAHGYYQFWVNVADADVPRFLRIFTDLPLSETTDETLQQAPINACKSVLAYECCALLHGVEAARAAHRAAQGAFGGRSIPQDLLPSSMIERAAQSDVHAVPTLQLMPAALTPGLLVVELLVTLGWCTSNNAARRLLVQGSVRLGDMLIVEPNHRLQTSDFIDGPIVLRAGKKRVHRLALGST